MAEITNELMYEVLKQIHGSVALLREDVHELKQRMTSVEHRLAQIHGDMANHSERMDRIEARLARVEKRLELQ